MVIARFIRNRAKKQDTIALLHLSMEGYGKGIEGGGGEVKKYISAKKQQVKI